MPADPTRSPLNAPLLRAAAARRPPGTAVIGPREGAPDPYLGAGSHPDVVERVWDQIGGGLPPEAAVRIYGTPALIHLGTGVILAQAYGTQYALRLLPDHLTEAKRAGARTVTTWAGGKSTDIAADFGPDWTFGNWDAREPAWCRALYDSLGG